MIISRSEYSKKEKPGATKNKRKVIIDNRTTIYIDKNKDINKVMELYKKRDTRTPPAQR